MTKREVATTRQSARSGQHRARRARPRRDYQLGCARRADGFGPDADESSGSKPPHPLQLAYPDHDVVVCEAGCDGPADAIVYLQKRQPGRWNDAIAGFSAAGALGSLGEPS